MSRLDFVKIAVGALAAICAVVGSSLVYLQTAVLILDMRANFNDLKTIVTAEQRRGDTRGDEIVELKEDVAGIKSTAKAKAPRVVVVVPTALVVIPATPLPTPWSTPTPKPRGLLNW